MKNKLTVLLAMFAVGFAWYAVSGPVTITGVGSDTTAIHQGDNTGITISNLTISSSDIGASTTYRLAGAQFFRYETLTGASNLQHNVVMGGNVPDGDLWFQLGAINDDAEWLGGITSYNGHGYLSGHWTIVGPLDAQNIISTTFGLVGALTAPTITVTNSGTGLLTVVATNSAVVAKPPTAGANMTITQAVDGTYYFISTAGAGTTTNTFGDILANGANANGLNPTGIGTLTATNETVIGTESNLTKLVATELVIRDTGTGKDVNIGNNSITNVHAIRFYTLNAGTTSKTFLKLTDRLNTDTALAVYKGDNAGDTSLPGSFVLTNWNSAYVTTYWTWGYSNGNARVAYPFAASRVAPGSGNRVGLTNISEIVMNDTPLAGIVTGNSALVQKGTAAGLIGATNQAFARFVWVSGTGAQAGVNTYALRAGKGLAASYTNSTQSRQTIQVAYQIAPTNGTAEIILEWWTPNPQSGTDTAYATQQESDDVTPDSPKGGVLTAYLNPGQRMRVRQNKGNVGEITMVDTGTFRVNW